MQINNNQPSFGSYNVLYNSMNSLSKNSKSLVKITLGKIESNLPKLSRGVNLEIGVRPYNPDNLFISLTNKRIFAKKHKFFMTIPVNIIGKSFSSFEFRDLLRSAVPAFKEAIKENKRINPTDLYEKVITKISGDLNKAA